MTIGSGAFSSTVMERGVNVSVVGDQNAFIKLESPNPQEIVAGEQKKIDLVTIENQLSVDLDITEVEVDADDIVVVEIDEPSIESGKRRTIKAMVECSDPGERTVKISLTASGDGIEVFLEEAEDDILERSFELVCKESDFSDCINVVDEINDNPGANGRTETGTVSLDGDDIDGYLYVEAAGDNQLDIDLDSLNVNGAIVVNADIGGNSINLTLDDVEVDGDICIKGHGEVDTTPDLSNVNNVSGDVKADVDGDADFSDVYKEDVEGEIDEDADLGFSNPPL